ncbi:MAG: hypothetical protein GC129_01335 [Proteobacteria bacterium]|nr:hypothetical protein [Pseudomonadota bacterium]
MLTIQPAPESSPPQAYAHACWVANPSISPSWWREALGHTFGKLALNWRVAVSTPQALTQGCNLILTSPATHAAAHAAIAASGVPAQAFATALCVEKLPPTLPQPAPTFVVWQPAAPPTAAQALATFTRLEQAVGSGALEAYGLYDADFTQPNPPCPLHQWLELAAQAAATVHGRRKRPALGLVLATVDLLTPQALTQPNTLHKQEPVSPLELASRLGLATVVVDAALPGDSSPPPAALQALTAFATAEQNLAAALGGWPAWQGQPLFSALAALTQGLAPWPTPAHWRHWCRHLLPLMEAQLATLPPQPSFAGYHRAAAALRQWGPSLAAAAAQPLQRAALARIAPQLPAAWHTLPPPALACALISSLPGVTALAVPAVTSLQDIQKLGDFPDPAILFTSPKFPV